MERPDIIVCGCGSWGRHIARNLHALGRLRGVVDTSRAGQVRARDCVPGVEVWERPEAALADSSVCGVMIATPAETHYRLACQTLEAGKDVFIEKPMTVDLEEAYDLLRRAESSDRIVMVGHLLEYHPAVRCLGELVRAGELGEIRYLISNRLNLGKVRTEENALWSFAPHDIAVILRLVGSMPVEVVATGGSYVQPDVADVTVTQLLFANGVRAHVFVSWLHPFKEQRLVVVGSRRMASFDDVAKKLVLYDQRVDVDEDNGRVTHVRGAGTDVEFADLEPLQQECLHFLECMETRHRPRTDAGEGARVLEILHASQRSLLAHGEPMPLIRPSADVEGLPTVVTRRLGSSAVAGTAGAKRR